MAQWAAARPGVETIRFRAPDGIVFANVDGAATAAGREAASLLGEPSPDARRTLERTETLLRARSAWTDYHTALTALSAEASAEQGRIRLARALYGGDMDGGIRAADDAWRTLFANLEARNPGLRNDPLILSLVRAPLLFTAENAVTEAARNLQQRWSAEVLAAVEGLEDEALQQTLAGEGGLLHVFAADAARPFLQPTATGFAASSALGRRFPLSTDFLRFLMDTPPRMAVYPASYPVRVRFTPVTVNPKSRAYPRGLSLRMDCGNGQTHADAYNYQEDAFFDWSPEQCGGLTLAILFDGFEADLVYDGPLGFARFVERASSGALDLAPADFPAVRRTLEAAGVSRIRTRFLIEGGEAVRAPALPPLSGTPRHFERRLSLFPPQNNAFPSRVRISGESPRTRASRFVLAF